MDIDTYIIGEGLKRARVQKGLPTSVLAQKLCCSEAQIIQVEDGGKSSFYTESQKLSLAKKMAQFLNVSPEEVFVSGSPKLPLNTKTLDFFEQKSQEKSKSKLSLGLSSLGLCLLGVLGYGMYTFFFANVNLYAKNSVQQKEIESIHGQAVNPSREPDDQSSATQVVAPITETVLAHDPCQVAKQNTISFTPSHANFSGNFIVFVSKAPETICVIDGLGHQQVVEIIPGKNKVVNGSGPFTVLGKNLSQIETYYQGSRVLNVQANTDSIALTEAPLVLKTDVVKPVVVSQSSETVISEPKPSIVKSISNNDTKVEIQNLSDSNAATGSSGDSETSSQE
jgi:cytoskeleton protein RodZ